MISDTSNGNRPEWLTDDVIKELRHDIEICLNPYTEEDIANWVFMVQMILSVIMPIWLLKH